MTRLAIMSDLHIDANEFGTVERTVLMNLLQDLGIDHLHIAGDISNDFEGISRPFLAELEAVCPVSYNLGNHDMLGMAEDAIQQRDGGLLPIGDHQLVHATGWYDYSFAPHLSQEEHLKNKNFYWFDRKLDRPMNDPALTQDSLAKLESLLAATTKPVVVALHMVPHRDFLIDHPYFQRFNGFLGSQAFHDLFVHYGVETVVFGHLHHRVNPRQVDGITYHCRPLGYTREWQLVRDFLIEHPEFQTDKKHRLAKRYHAIRDLPAFQDYRAAHLAQEFRSSMTILDL